MSPGTHARLFRIDAEAGVRHDVPQLVAHFPYVCLPCGPLGNARRKVGFARGKSDVVGIPRIGAAITRGKLAQMNVQHMTDEFEMTGEHGLPCGKTFSWHAICASIVATFG